MGNKSGLQPSGLLARLANDSGLHADDVRRVLKRLAHENWLEGTSLDGLPIAMIRVLEPCAPAEVPVLLGKWRLALSEADLSGGDAKTLEPLFSALDGMSPDAMVEVAKGLIRLRNEQTSRAGVPKFIVSSEYLLSSSKMLSGFSADPIKKFGINVDLFPDGTPYVIVAGPPNPEAVVLIENPMAFERAISVGAANKVAMVVTFGYGLSRRGDGFGRQLAELVTEYRGSLVPLTREGNPPSLERLFGLDQIYFWGDLDPEGLKIFMRLRGTLSNLRLSRLYQWMARRLEGTKGHPYTVITGKEGQVGRALSTDFPNDVRSLHEACLRRGIDQECVPAHVVQTDIGKPLELPA